MKKSDLSPIRKVLIANRGEIACRIARAAKLRGIQSVSLYTAGEARYPQVSAASESVALGTGSLKETYLNAERLIAIAKKTHCDAIHPGYGFLSENADFAKACETAGLIFIGPPPDAIRLMGDKIEAKRLVRSLGLPLVPGYNGDNQSAATLRQEAEGIGFPLLIKASAGGGGKGMRIVRTAGEFDEALAGCKREAEAAFGSSTVLLEKYLERPRHIEIQVAADACGNRVTLGERECSIQRRYQKIIEESPSPCVDAVLREKMAAAAVALVKEIGYCNLGTVEFLLDEKKNFYFLEMNTRLQVEHPVTEESFGIDLVQLQFDLAEGKPLPVQQSDCVPTRHAIECRLYAEDPDNDFLPSIGTLHALSFPSLSGLRLDMGVVEGNEVLLDFDPMLGKIIAHGKDRSEALAILDAALGKITVTGVTSNLSFLQKLCASSAFRKGQIHTHLVRELQAGWAEAEEGEDLGSPWERYHGFNLMRGTGPHAVQNSDTPLQSPRTRRQSSTELHGTLSSPMPGKVLKLAVKSGDLVKKGDLLLVLEAMKMEHRLTAPGNGSIACVSAKEGDIVQAGKPLLEITYGT